MWENLHARHTNPHTDPSRLWVARGPACVCLHCVISARACWGTVSLRWLTLRGCRPQQLRLLSIHRAARESASLETEAALIPDCADYTSIQDRCTVIWCLLKGFVLVWHVSVSSVDDLSHAVWLFLQAKVVESNQPAFWLFVNRLWYRTVRKQM